MNNNGKEINVNNIDGNIVLFNSRFKDLNQLHWRSEINSDGDSFDYDSQDIYRHLLEEMLYCADFVEKIGPETHKEERQVLLEDLEETLTETIKLFKVNRIFFMNLPRKNLVIKELRKRKYPNSTQSDKSLYTTFIHAKEIQNREEYFTSELYKEIGFLEKNYHEEYYNYAIHLRSQIVNSFENFESFESDHLKVHNKPFFHLGVVHHIHNACNGSVFHELNELDLYKALNLQNNVPYLEKENQKELFYLFYKLGELLDDRRREVWLRGILKEVQVTRKYYNTKYKAVTWENSTANQRQFVTQLDSLFKDKINPIL